MITMTVHNNNTYNKEDKDDEVTEYLMEGGGDKNEP
jgi:hypothetical protein